MSEDPVLAEQLAVVRRQHDERAVVAAEPSELGEETPDLVIHVAELAVVLRDAVREDVRRREPAGLQVLAVDVTHVLQAPGKETVIGRRRGVRLVGVEHVQEEERRAAGLVVEPMRHAADEGRRRIEVFRLVDPEAARETEGRIEVGVVRQEGRGVVAGRGEPLGERLDRGVEGRRGVRPSRGAIRAVGRRQAAGQERSVPRDRPRTRRDRPPVENARVGEGVDAGRRRARVPVGREMIGAHGVEHDHHDVGARVGRAARARERREEEGEPHGRLRHRQAPASRTGRPSTAPAARSARPTPLGKRVARCRPRARTSYGRR